MFTIIARVVVDAAAVAIVLFGAAGTFDWPRAWVLLAVLLCVRLVSTVAVFRVNPALLRERATVLVHRDQPLADKLILLAFIATAFVGVPAVAALDVFHWRLLPSVPAALSALGLVLFAIGWIVKAMALRANAFAVTVVRVQGERQHAVVDTGLYGMIRHPMYAGNPLVNVGLGLWLGSYAAAMFAIVPLALLMLRIVLEERHLLRELSGYREYTGRIQYRLLPGIW